MDFSRPLHSRGIHLVGPVRLWMHFKFLTIMMS